MLCDPGPVECRVMVEMIVAQSQKDERERVKGDREIANRHAKASMSVFMPSRLRRSKCTR